MDQLQDRPVRAQRKLDRLLAGRQGNGYRQVPGADRKLDEAAHWAATAASPDDDQLPQPEPAPCYDPDPEADNLTIPGPRSIQEAAQRSSFIEDEPGMSFSPTPRNLDKPTGFDGMTSTAYGPLLPKVFGQLKKIRKLDKYGALVPKGPQATRQKTVRALNGRKFSVVSALTLEDYIAARNERKRAEDDAADYRATTGRVARELARACVSRSDPPPTTYTLETRKQAPSAPAVPLAENLKRYPTNEEFQFDADYFDPRSFEMDNYDVAAWRAGWPSVEEEDKAWEQAHGVPLGSLEADRQQALADDTAEVAMVTAQWRSEIAALQQSGDPRFAPDGRRSCGNPNGCPNAVKGGRGERCSPCYEYRRDPKHRGQERPAYLINRAQRRKAA